ncbi:MAG: nucleoside hydrolase [Planctomycetota bacterium]|jgi:inosine-uridine nucleoside N-ribohydrolase
MRNVIVVISLICFHLSAVARPVKVIFDTDMESDVDDVGALAMLHGFANRGEAEILATISSSLNPWSAPTIDVINTFFGRPDIPIGNVKTLGVYRNSKYARMISEKYPQDIGLGENAPNANQVYRKVLSGQPDNSVVIVTVGYLTNLSKLLNTEADKHSPLSGMELVAKKVKHLVCMGGRYPLEQNPGKWGNFKPDPQAIRHVANDWPTMIIFTTGGDFANAIPTGKILFETDDTHPNPVREAYAIFLDGWDRKYHHSADLIAVYVAVKGHEPYFKLRTHGYFHIFEDGTHMWRFSPNEPKHYIVAEFAEKIDRLNVASDFDRYMTQFDDK